MRFLSYHNEQFLWAFTYADPYEIIVPDPEDGLG